MMYTYKGSGMECYGRLFLPFSEWCSFASSAVESHFAHVLVSGSLIKASTLCERRTVQM